MDFAKLTVMGLVAATGATGHSLTLVVLHRLKQKINKSLDTTTRRLMVSQAWCDLLLCALGLPVEMWNMTVGNKWPFTLPAACYYLKIIVYNLTSVSIAHMTIMAAWRCTALVAPSTHSRLTNKVVLQVLIISVPWVLGYVFSFLFYMNSSWRAAYNAASGVCAFMPVDHTPSSETKFATSSMVIGLLNTLIPIALGCAIYTFILIKLKRRQKRTFVATLVTITATSGQAALNTIRNISLYGAVRVVAWACFVNMALQYPIALCFATAIYRQIAQNYPLVRLLLDFLYFGSFCATPFVYAASSRDMRAVYKDLLRANLIHRWWSRKKQHQVLLLEMHQVTEANREERKTPTAHVPALPVRSPGA